MPRRSEVLVAIKATAHTRPLPERWIAHRPQPSDPNEVTAGIYAWNIALCASLYPALHALEVTLRNRIFAAASAKYPTSKYFEVNCWLDAKPRILLPDQVVKVMGAKKSLKRTLKRKYPTPAMAKHHLTPDRLVAELTFGFWTYLFDPKYGGTVSKPGILWPTLLPIVFPNNPSIQRKDADKRLIAVRQLRNRIFHYETIWNRATLPAEYAALKETLGWLSPEAEVLVTRFETFPSIYSSPPSSGRFQRWFRREIYRVGFT